MGRLRLARLATLGAALVGLTIGGGVAAQDATPAPGPGLPPAPAGCTAIADGLLAPRSIAIAEDGTVYVTETGIGGDEVIVPPDSGSGEVAATPAEGEATPAPEEAAPPSTRGYTGQVTAIAPDGTQSVVASGFASYSDGVGPEGIVLVDGQLYVTIGGGGVGAGITPLPEENTVYKIDPATGEATILAELGPYEEANNPDGTDVNPNLYGIALGADGQLYVNDAGGNTIYKVDPATGAFELAAIVPSGVPDRQPVPTSIALAPDGTLHLAILSEGWPADAASVLSLAADGTFTGLANGLSFVVGLGVGPDGATYVSQLTTGLGAEGPMPGSVLRVNADGSTEIVVDGLMLPNGIAFDAAGNLYVATVSVNLGPGAPLGQVLRCDGIAHVM